MILSYNNTILRDGFIPSDVDIIEPEVQQWLTETGIVDATVIGVTPNSFTGQQVKYALNTFVRQLKYGFGKNYWRQVLLCFPFAGGTPAANRLSLKFMDLYSVSETGTNGFTTGFTHDGVGVKGNGSVRALVNGFSPVALLGSRDRAIVTYSQTATASGAWDCGTAAAQFFTASTLRTGTTNAAIGNGSSTAISVNVGSSGGSGCFIFNINVKADVNGNRMFINKNGVDIFSASSSPTLLGSSVTSWGCYGTGGSYGSPYPSKTISMHMVLSGFLSALDRQRISASVQQLQVNLNRGA